MRKLKINGIYKHFKGNHYLVENIAENSETKEMYVIYRRLYGDTSLKCRPLEMFLSEVDHDSFLKSMADAAKTITDFYQDKIVYINAMVNMSVDCDCCYVAEDPCMQDIGILASLDPVALDQACIDLVYNSSDPGRDHLVERIESRNGLLTIKSAEEQGIGTREYELISID